MKKCEYLVKDLGHSYYCKKLRRWISERTCLKCRKGAKHD
jgi:hypothetical protein